MRVLITGTTGMAGSHLAEYILANHHDAEVYGTYRWRSRMDNLQDLSRNGLLRMVAEGGNISRSGVLARMIEEQGERGHLNLIECDLTDAASVKKVISAVRPSHIFHLAAQSYVPASWNAPATTLNINAGGQIHIFEAVIESELDPRIHIAGSSEEYGLVLPDEVPIKESNPLRPLSTYAVSKVTQEMLAWQYFQSYGLKTVVTRGFNHTGPRRGHVFVTSSFAKQIAEIEVGRRPQIVQVGDLSSKRDWTDVRDIVRGYWLAAEHGIPGEVYNIGSGVARTAGDMLNLLLSMSQAKIEVRQDESRMRPSDVKILLSDSTKLCRQTGWHPEIPFERTMRDLLDYWRERV